jgi:hypothetical protein
VLRRFFIGGTMAVVTVLVGLATFAAGPGPAPPVPSPMTPIPASEMASCASACQAAHDQCRVRRKGSPSCDAERQACLEKCLQKRR